MAVELDMEFGLTADMIPSSGGVFEVDFDGRRIFSKKELNRFPEEDEVQDIIRGLVTDK